LSTNSDELFEDIHEYFYLFGASAENWAQYFSRMCLFGYSHIPPNIRN
jgi:hypothetical protein